MENKEITKAYVRTLSKEQKKQLYDYLISQGLDAVFVGYLIYDRDYKDVIKDETANPNNTANV